MRVREFSQMILIFDEAHEITDVMSIWEFLSVLGLWKLFLNNFTTRNGERGCYQKKSHSDLDAVENTAFAVTDFFNFAYRNSW